MEWFDEGIILASRKYGENSHIVSIFTQNNGKHSGLVRGLSKNNILQLGNLVSVRWRSRNEANLGCFQLELVQSFATRYLKDALRLSTISSACALIEKTLPERENYQNLYDCFKNMFDNIASDNWAEIYVKWEVLLLASLGYGLNLSSCIATGAKDDLIYVSPKSGCAVSKIAGYEYQNILLPLPSFLIKNETDNISSDDIAKGLKLTEYFFKRHIFNNIKLPFARNRLASFFVGNSNEQN